MIKEELLKLGTELYHRAIAEFATNFAIDVTETLTKVLPPPQDIIVLDIIDKFSPNDYSSILIPTLQTKGYLPSLYHIETNENGTYAPKNFPPQSIVKGRPVLYVGVNFSPLVWTYLQYSLERNVSKAIFASPIPPPSALWEYVEGRTIRLQK